MSRSRLERLRAVRAVLHAAAAPRRPSIKSDINVTPLVDVVLVLLIIFMVVTPLIASGVAVDLPRTHFHARSPDDGRDIVVSVTSDGRLYVGTSRVDGAEELTRRVVSEKRRFPDRAVYVKGDALAPYGPVRALMEGLHDANIDDVVLATEEAARER